MSEEREIVGRVPVGEVTEKTEFVFVRGLAFVNALKHTEVVAMHVERLASLRAAGEELRALLLVRDGKRDLHDRIDAALSAWRKATASGATGRGE